MGTKRGWRKNFGDDPPPVALLDGGDPDTELVSFRRKGNEEDPPSDPAYALTSERDLFDDGLNLIACLETDIHEKRYIA